MWARRRGFGVVAELEHDDRVLGRGMANLRSMAWGGVCARFRDTYAESIGKPNERRRARRREQADRTRVQIKHRSPRWGRDKTVQAERRSQTRGASSSSSPPPAIREPASTSDADGRQAPETVRAAKTLARRSGRRGIPSEHAAGHPPTRSGGGFSRAASASSPDPLVSPPHTRRGLQLARRIWIIVSQNGVAQSPERGRKSNQIKRRECHEPRAAATAAPPANKASVGREE